MEPLRRLMFPKEDHPWKTILYKWNQLLETGCDLTSVGNDNLNPWKEWCRSWEIYKRSNTKTPKKGKERAVLWQELYHVAKFTEDKLDEAKTMHQQLKKQKAELSHIQKENLLLKTKCEELQNQLAYKQQQQILDDQHHKEEIKKEVNQRLSVQKQNKELLASLQESETKRWELENQTLALQGQLVQLKEENDVSNKFIYNQYHKNITIVKYQSIKQCIEGEESWHDMAKRAGVGCPSRYKILKRLQYHEGPSWKNKSDTYWQLVVRLSRYEDLVTREPR